MTDETGRPQEAVMKTTIELNDAQAKALEYYCRAMELTPEQAIQRVLNILAPQSPTQPRRALREHPAFGLWRHRNISALDYQEQLRNEWL